MCCGPCDVLLTTLHAVAFCSGGQQDDNERPSQALASCLAIYTEVSSSFEGGCLAANAAHAREQCRSQHGQGHSSSFRNLAGSSVKLVLTCLQVTQKSALFQANAGNAFANTFAKFIAGVLQVSTGVHVADWSSGLLKVAAGLTCLPEGPLAGADGALHAFQHCT